MTDVFDDWVRPPCFTAAAELKHHNGARAADEQARLRGFTAAAELKPEARPGLARLAFSLRGFTAAAELKPACQITAQLLAERSPRLHRRGRIEATASV